jgi:hypothetical protein
MLEDQNSDDNYMVICRITDWLICIERSEHEVLQSGVRNYSVRTGC